MGIQSFLQTIVQNAATWGEVTPVAARGEILEKVPPSLFNALAEKGRQLPAPRPCQATVKAGMVEAITRWQANPDIENNSLVVLSRPVEDLGAILRSALQTEATPEEDRNTQAKPDSLAECTLTFLMKGYQRPLDPLAIKEHISRELEKLPECTDTASSIVVMPRLEQCFLRCIQGWEGIEYLQNLTTRDPSRFWIFGCNHWAWAFLDRVCQISAYLEQPLDLPELSSTDLKQWLLPFFSDVMTVLNLEMPEEELILSLEMGPDGYWTSLANLSSGIGATAARLWLKSLRVRTSETETLSLLPAKPALPSAITFNTIDRYLLHSLLIHGEMTRAHLALSLGEAERKIRDRLQVLKREGIILQKGRRLSVHPAHYPRLYNELKNNNFLIGAR
ncbi:MAG: hypothetical protein AB8B99_15300 [Phormidesmis sp.]